MAWHDENLPMPYWTAQTQKNGHAHICYKLEIPLCTSEFGSQKAIAYASKIQVGLANKLGADVGYSHLITKNPFHKDWRVTFWTEQAYTLDYLADFVELPKKLNKNQEVLGLGRNCTLFDTVRKWAYKAIRAHRGGTFDVWLGEVLKQCKNVNNAFLEPLLYSEVRATAKSIAIYCWKKDAYCYQEFIDRQIRKGRLGGLKSNSSNGGIARANLYNERKKMAFSLKEQGIKINEIALALDVSRKTVSNWLKSLN